MSPGSIRLQTSSSIGRHIFAPDNNGGLVFTFLQARVNVVVNSARRVHRSRLGLWILIRIFIGVSMLSTADDIACNPSDQQTNEQLLITVILIIIIILISMTTMILVVIPMMLLMVMFVFMTMAVVACYRYPG